MSRELSSWRERAARVRKPGTLFLVTAVFGAMMLGCRGPDGGSATLEADGGVEAPTGDPAPAAIDGSGTSVASPAPGPDTRPEGARGFDFLVGPWTIHNRVLRERLKGSTEWDEWDATLDVVPILGGMGQVDRFRGSPDGEFYEGSTLRLFDPAAGEWKIYWMDVRSYRLLPQVGGKMTAEGGTFFGAEEFEGDTVQMRFRWTPISADSARWDQAYRMPDGDWEVNWEMLLVRR